MALLEVKNLKTYYQTLAGDVKAVDNVSFNLQKGEVLGLAGESGCGKTTACMSIMRMIQRPGVIVGGKILYENTSDVIQRDFVRDNTFPTLTVNMYIENNQYIISSDQVVEISSYYITMF